MVHAISSILEETQTQFRSRPRALRSRNGGTITHHTHALSPSPLLTPTSRLSTSPATMCDYHFGINVSKSQVFLYSQDTGCSHVQVTCDIYDAGEAVVRICQRMGQTKIGKAFKGTYYFVPAVSLEISVAQLHEQITEHLQNHCGGTTTDGHGTHDIFVTCEQMNI